MKKAIASVTFAAALLVASGASAHNTGCGLGDQIFHGADSVLLQVLAVTTNGTFGNITFGITSGTLGCVPPRSLVFRDGVTKFVAANMDNLAKDVAQGKGESLETLAEMMEVPAANRAMFGSAMQANFSSIFTHEGIQAGAVIDNIASVAQTHHII
jgi:hypothetical protein